MPGRTALRPQKLARVQEIKRLLLDHPVTALVAVRGVPAAALQKMRRNLRARGHPLFVTSNSALRHALQEAANERPALLPLVDYVVDQTALIAAEGNPFSLYRELAETRSATPARGGAIAPADILVPGGETPFKPGPIVAELQHAGFPAAIEKGKVVLKKETVIVKAGEIISAEKATLLTRLNIFPLEVGLELRAAVERDTFYAPALLAVDLAGLRTELVRAHRTAVALAVELGYFAPTTIPILLSRAQRGALALAGAAAYLIPASLPVIVARARREAGAVEALMGTPES